MGTEGTKTHRCRTYGWNLEPRTPFSPSDNELLKSPHTEVVSPLLSTTLRVGGCPEGVIPNSYLYPG